MLIPANQMCLIETQRRQRVVICLAFAFKYRIKNHLPEMRNFLPRNILSSSSSLHILPFLDPSTSWSDLKHSPAWLGSWPWQPRKGPRSLCLDQSGGAYSPLPWLQQNKRTSYGPDTRTGEPSSWVWQTWDWHVSWRHLENIMLLSRETWQ